MTTALNHDAGLMLGLSQAELRQAGAQATAKEISQQPELWRTLLDGFEQETAGWLPWLTKVLQQPGLRLILTGAGTSAYIGEALAPYLQQQLGSQAQVQALATTDLVSHPQLYLAGDQPVLLVSYGRSGNSPESVAAAQMVRQLHPDSHHLVLSCNADGKLAQMAVDDAATQLWLMPAEANDQSFAMTSSYSCMLFATMLLFGADKAQASRMIALSQHLLQHSVTRLKSLSAHSCDRIVFLGSGPLKAVARELALKYLELTAGQIPSFYETSLGFRHGPKSLVNQSTQIVLLDALDPYSRRYDLDMQQELCQDQQALSVQLCSELLDTGLLPDDDSWLCFPYALCGQLLAFFKAIELGISPDNPCPTGLVNRVVQGVTIYPLFER
ncbi:MULTISPECIES: SIS domain-containing protein [Alkalimonas]|uniref:SIS domain-containing protein n=1 Tax=Alkalimonas mucilaginosa TaxID=3057676 RepID=A0ABU7JHJ7_9GAMM|nr:SIS domain-containing protein [Alkalimonas sp. MEB004]MEE2024935.1 SIS domain-containing protein [Alkalimonas sp. MEB004]